MRLLRLFKKGRVKGSRAQVGQVLCTGRCGQVKLIAKKGRKVVGRSRYSLKGAKAQLTFKLVKAGKRLLAHRRRLKVKVGVWVTPPGGRIVHRQRRMVLIKK